MRKRRAWMASSQQRKGLLFLGGIGLMLVMCLQAVLPGLSSSLPAGEVAAGGSGASEMVYVPAGQFLMGCSDDLYAQGCDGDTHPIHGVYVDAFYIDKLEVTNAQYRACVAAGVCPPPLAVNSNTRPHYYDNPAYDDFPVINVDWNRANIYCHWVGKRLPTEAEWEKAARGTDLREYPWGNTPPSCDIINFTEGTEWPNEHPCVEDTVRVGSYPQNASPYGALDMAGNVSEWVSDFYLKPYYQDSPYWNPQGPPAEETKGEHLLRGGSWHEKARSVTTVVRLDESETYHYLQIGFRCAKSAEVLPTPTPTPTPTPFPAAARSIGPEGGAIWTARPGHLELLTVGPGQLTRTVVITLSEERMPWAQGELYGQGSFFTLAAREMPSGTSALTSLPPLTITVGYTDHGAVISRTLSLYYFDPDGGGWVTEALTLTTWTPSYVQAQVQRPGLYALLGQTIRLYLPTVWRSDR